MIFVQYKSVQEYPYSNRVYQKVGHKEVFYYDQYKWIKNYT
jgi:hypothetical protein